jgi:hypothetical protein
VHLTVTGALGVTSPPLAPSHCTCAGAKKQSCSLRSPRQQRRRLRVVEMGAPSGGEPSAGTPEEVEESTIDFAFVSVSSSRASLVCVCFDAPSCPRVRDWLTAVELVRALVSRDVAATDAAGRDAGRALPDGARRAEAQGRHARRLHRPLRALRESH